jgi:hypothetical protein
MHRCCSGPQFRNHCYKGWNPDLGFPICKLHFPLSQLNTFYFQFCIFKVLLRYKLFLKRAQNSKTSCLYSEAINKEYEKISGITHQSWWQKSFLLYLFSLNFLPFHYPFTSFPPPYSFSLCYLCVLLLHLTTSLTPIPLFLYLLPSDLLCPLPFLLFVCLIAIYLPVS